MDTEQRNAFGNQAADKLARIREARRAQKAQLQRDWIAGKPVLCDEDDLKYTRPRSMHERPRLLWTRVRAVVRVSTPRASRPSARRRTTRSCSSRTRRSASSRSDDGPSSEPPHVARRRRVAQHARRAAQ
jgi:hypothetical protein